jgi:hypothetical protein
MFFLSLAMMFIAISTLSASYTRRRMFFWSKTCAEQLGAINGYFLLPAKYSTKPKPIPSVRKRTCVQEQPSAT